MSWWDDIADGSKYLIETGVDVYKTSLDAKTAQKANEAAAAVAQAKSDDIVTIGNIEISVTKSLAILAGTFGLLWLLTMSKRG